jgi:hypothetical protein
MMRKLTLGLLCVAVASAILSGCGGSGGSGSQSLLPSEPSVPITRGRLIQHGDEYEYVITGTAFYQNARWQVTGSRVERFRSVGAGVYQWIIETQLVLRRGSLTERINTDVVLYITQDRETRQVSVIGYGDMPNSPRIDAELPYQPILPGVIHQNSNFSTTITFEDESQYTVSWQIGGWEDVSTYAGSVGCYRIREEGSWSRPLPFTEATVAATAWFSPQLMNYARIETRESGWIGANPVEYTLTYLLRRTNVPLRPQTGAQAQ